MNYLNTLCRAAAVSTVLIAAAVGTAAQAQQLPWTTVGSAGTVDESDIGIADLVLGEARVRATAPAGSQLNIRYNVVALPGFDGPGQYLMRVRFRDNGPFARVQLNLRRYNTNGPTSQVASFDSNAYAPQPGYQVQQRCILVNWDFVAGPYYVDAAMTKLAPDGQPALGTVQLIRANCAL